MRIEYAKQAPTDLKADVLIVGVFEGQKASPAVKRLDAALGGHLSLHVKDDEFGGKELSSLAMHAHGKIPAKKIVLLGLGASKGFTAERLRRAAGAAVKTATAMKARSAAISLPFEKAICPPAEAAQAMIEGFFLAAYRFEKYRFNDGKKKEKRLETMIAVLPPSFTEARMKTAEEHARALAEASGFARDLVNTPALDMTPKHLVEEAGKVAASSPRIRLKTFDRAALQKMGCGGILAVAQGSQHEPYMLHLTYRPHGKTKKRIVLVGKGVTFDSGGLSLKPSEGMMDMKIDMAGAAAVLGVFKALAKLEPNVEVHGIAGLVENMPSGTAIRPGDIVRTMSGKTIEILNTDAEGRVTLADTLFYGSKLKPDMMIDLATLTGACMVALGQNVAGLMSNDAKLAQKLLEASSASGEQLWELPLVPEYAEMVKSKHADLKNITGGRYGGAITAGLFLKEFVGETPWAHLDIAGPAHEEKDHPDYRVWGASGFGVRLMLEYLMKL